MTEKSVTYRLSELFELFKSGALTKVEYDLLKSQIISAGVSNEPRKTEKAILSSDKQESVHQFSDEAESNQGHLSGSPNETTLKPSPNIPDKGDLHSVLKTGIYGTVMIVSLLLIVIFAIYIISRRTNVGVTEYSLFCKLTDEPIYTNDDGKYDIWYSSHEEPYPHHKITTKDELSKLLFYKFKDYETCKKWCDAKKQLK